MGELHVNMNITLDGVIQANGGPTEEDAGFAYAGWETPYGDAESGAQITADVQASDALLLGRTTYDIFRRYWPGKTDGIGRAFDRVPKYVASRGAPELSWDNSIQITDAGAEVRDLRQRHEQIHTWGSADLLQTLFREGLVDQVNLWVCPVVIGQGKRLFPEGTVPTRFEQVEPPKAYPGGAISLRYRRLEGPPETVTERGRNTQIGGDTRQEPIQVDQHVFRHPRGLLMLVRRLSTVAAATVAVVALTASAASAHFCYFSNPNANGNAGRAGSNGFVPFGVLAAEITGLCPAGVQVLADAAGVEMDTLINAHGLMAGPTDGNNAISHLDFDAIDAAFPAAAAACA